MSIKIILSIKILFKSAAKIRNFDSISQLYIGVKLFFYAVLVTPELKFTQLSSLKCFVNTILFSVQNSNHKKFSLSSKSGTLLPEFPKANTVQLPEGVSIYKVRYPWCLISKSWFVILYK